MGSIGDCLDNRVAESFFGSLQLELHEHDGHWDSVGYGPDPRTTRFVKTF